MKLTSSGNVMLVTFSFSRQRHGAIFKAYFQAIPKAGVCLPSMPFRIKTNIWLLATVYMTPVILLRQNAEAFCQLGMAPWYPLTILPTTLQTWTVTGRSGWVEARDGSHVLTLLLGVSAHGLWTVFTASGGMLLLWTLFCARVHPLKAADCGFSFRLRCPATCYP